MLPNEISEKIEELSTQGNGFFDEGSFEEAIRCWSMALGLLPPPVASWDAFGWLSASIGDARYQLKKYPEALHSLLDAYSSDPTDANPFVLYRIGQCYEKTQHMEKAMEFLLQTYMVDGSDIFEADDEEGAYYYSLLKTQKLVN